MFYFNLRTSLFLMILVGYALVFPKYIFAENYFGVMPSNFGIITAQAIQDSYINALNYVQLGYLNEKDEGKREKYLSFYKDRLEQSIRPYLSLLKATGVNQVKKNILFPAEKECVTKIADDLSPQWFDYYREKCISRDWIISEGKLSFYYIIVASRAALFRVEKNTLSLVWILESEAGTNFNFEPKFYHRKLDNEDVLLIHLHGVADGNGMFDHEYLAVVNKDGTLSLVDTSKMYSQLNSLLKDKYAIHRNHSFLSEDSFIYWASTRSKIESRVVAAQYKLKKLTSDGVHQYVLEIDPSTAQIASKQMNTLGLEKYKIGQFQEAISLFKKAIQQTPSQYDVVNYDAYSNLGLAQFKAGYLEESIKSLELVINSRYGRFRQADEKALYHLGLAYEKKKCLAKAEDYYFKAYRLSKLKAYQQALESVRNKKESWAQPKSCGKAM